MSLLPVLGFGFKVGHVLLMICCWFVSVIPMSWLSSGGIMESKPSLLGGDGGGSGGGKGVGNWWVKIAAKIRKFNYYHYIGSVKLRKSWWKKLLVAWIVFWVLFCFGVFWCMSSYAVEKRKESLASMCDERARMLQDQFNVSLNHIQAMSIMISTFHHGKIPSAIDQVKLQKFLVNLSSSFDMVTSCM